ncbi:hypothetical protein M405DRAFT_168269 [Rhizopogon salebrosus TDB-379]|nr:hypothetical protein M405DRAFT_168269 [Rhizopogon salebrosus TDB-379]
MSDKAKRTKNPPWRFCSLAAYLFKTLGNTKGIYSQALIPFQPGMRGTREKTSRCTSIKRLQIIPNPGMICASRSRS